MRAILPKLVALPEKQAPAAFKRIFYAKPPPLGPTQLLVALHELSPSRDGVGVEAVKRAVKLCMDAPKFFDEGALEEALRQLVRIEPLPWLLLRTILQVRHHVARIVARSRCPARAAACSSAPPRPPPPFLSLTSPVPCAAVRPCWPGRS